jgi:hypothetical protein
MLLEYAKAFCKRMEQWTPRPLRAAWCFPKLTSVEPAHVHFISQTHPIAAPIGCSLTWHTRAPHMSRMVMGL